jgi:hypothetical protein
MTVVTPKDIMAAVGPVDDLVVAEIIGMSATVDELAEAGAWIANDEAMMNMGQPLAKGRVSRLLEIIVAAKEAEEQEPSTDR